MNSMYGKFVQKPIYTFHKTKFDKNLTKINEIEMEDNKIFQYQDFTLDKQMNCSNPIIGIQILAMSKIIMNEHINTCDGFRRGIYYTDTDSIVVEKDQYEMLVKKNCVGSEFGKLKLEMIIDNFYGFGKKMYFIDGYLDVEKNKKCKEIKMVFKGIGKV